MKSRLSSLAAVAIQRFKQDGIIPPAMLAPVERYISERKTEFLLSNGYRRRRLPQGPEKMFGSWGLIRIRLPICDPYKGFSAATGREAGPLQISKL